MQQVQQQLVAKLTASNPKMVQNFLHNCNAFGQVL
jgi:hypothetical protein